MFLKPFVHPEDSIMYSTKSEVHRMNKINTERRAVALAQLRAEWSRPVRTVPAESAPENHRSIVASLRGPLR